MQRTSKVVANAATAAARQLMSSGSKAMRQNKNQGSDATVQQGDESMTTNAQGASAFNDNEWSVNATQEHATVDPNASLLSDLESQAPRFATNATSATTPTSGATPSASRAPAPAPSSTPPRSQNATLASNAVPHGINPSTPPRLNASGISGVTDVGEDLLSNQGTSMAGCWRIAHSNSFSKTEHTVSQNASVATDTAEQCNGNCGALGFFK